MLPAWVASAAQSSGAREAAARAGLEEGYGRLSCVRVEESIEGSGLAWKYVFLDEVPRIRLE